MGMCYFILLFASIIVQIKASDLGALPGAEQQQQIFESNVKSFNALGSASNHLRQKAEKIADALANDEKYYHAWCDFANEICKHTNQPVVARKTNPNKGDIFKIINQIADVVYVYAQQGIEKISAEDYQPIKENYELHDGWINGMGDFIGLT